MQTKQYTTINRESVGWPRGEWDGEPDKVQWQDGETGLPCLAVRNPKYGHWCGYVGVQDSHPLHGKDYNDVNFDVHGGITYTNSCQPTDDESRGVCHTPEPGEPDHVWWFGFDCAHCGDFSPSDTQRAIELGYPFRQRADETYKTLEYVQDQCRKLALQIASQVTK